MHELAVVMSIVNIAEQEAAKENASIIELIELDIGALSGIEIEALEFAWKQGVKHTMLEKALKKINFIEAVATCADCAAEFIIEHYYDNCPVCAGHLLHIKKGKELKVKSLVIS